MLSNIFVVKTGACWIFSLSKKKKTKKHFYQENKQKQKPTLFHSQFFLSTIFQVALFISLSLSLFNSFFLSFYFARPDSQFFSSCLVLLIYSAQFHYCWRLRYHCDSVSPYTGPLRIEEYMINTTNVLLTNAKNLSNEFIMVIWASFFCVC